jgi:hypothetical protein
MPSVVASTSSRVGATRKAPAAAASQGSCHPRCARARFRGCGPTRSTSAGGRRRCCAREEGEVRRRRRARVCTCAGRSHSTPGSCRGRSAAPRAARR